MGVWYPLNNSDYAAGIKYSYCKSSAYKDFSTELRESYYV